jgi:hypothetical protein
MPVRWRAFPVTTWFHLTGPDEASEVRLDSNKAIGLDMPAGPDHVPGGQVVFEFNTSQCFVSYPTGCMSLME